jgi:hypothetical protein
LLEALETIDMQDQWEIAAKMPRKGRCLWPRMKGHSRREWAETRATVERITEEKSFLAELAVSAAAAWPRPQMRPSTMMAYLIIKDIASIFEWYCGLEATRQVDRISNEETGPFYGFAAALWPVVFRKGDEGLPAAIKNFAQYRKSEGRPLMANMAMRNPEWRLFEG